MKTNPTFTKPTRAKALLLLAFLALLAASAVKAESLILYSSSSGSNQYVPMSVYNSSSNMYSCAQFVVPGDILTDMTDGYITMLRFNTTTNIAWTTMQDVTVYLTGMDQTSISAFVDQDSATVVFHGTAVFKQASPRSSTIDINFTTAYHYTGGNLLIGVETRTNVGSSTIKFYGATVGGASVSGVGPIGSTLTPTQRNFIPRTVIFYTMMAPPSDLTATPDPDNGTVASLSWTENGTATQWELQYATDSTFAESATTSLMVTDTPSAALSGLSLETTYYARVRSVGDNDPSPWSNSVSFTTSNVLPPPANLAVSNLTDQSATLTWTVPETDQTVTGYAYQYRLASDGVWSDETTVNVTSVTLSGLTLNTTYDFRVKALYAGGNVSNFETVTFITEGLIETLPHYQGFEDGMGGWRVVDDNQSTGIYYNPTYGIYSFGFVSSGSSPLYLISPQFDNGSLSMTVSFYYQNSSYTTTADFQVGYSTTTKDLTAFTWSNEMTSSQEWQQYVDTFPVGTKYVAVKWIRGGWLYLDDFNFDTPCPAPSNVNVSVNGTDATVSWSSDAGAWQLCLNDDGNYIDVNEPTYTFTGLEPCTTYTVKVRSNCGAVEGMSRWTSPFSFTLNSITAFPWTENFESFNTGTVPGDCWDNSASTSATLGNHPEYLWGVYGYGGNKMLRMDNAMVAAGTALINSPMIYLPSGITVRLQFDYSHRASCGPFTVRVSEDGGATFVDLASYANLGSSISPTDPGEFTEATLSLTGYAGKSVMLQFYAEADHGQGAIFVDNIEIHTYQCSPPTGLTVSDLTDHSATLSWTAPNNYVLGYSYGCLGWNGNDYSTHDTINTTSVTLSDLTANTQYMFLVKAIYEGSAFSDFIFVFFRTEGELCEGGVESLPHYQGFEDGMGCWRIVDGYAGLYGLGTGISDQNPYDGDYCFGFLSGANTNHIPQYLISPEFAGDSAMTVSFYYFLGRFQVGYSTTTDDVGDFIWGSQLMGSNEWSKYENSFPVGTKYVAVKNSVIVMFLDDFSFVNSEDYCSGVASLPHDQGFEDGMGCWSIVDGAVGPYGFWSTGISDDEPHNGNYCFEFWADENQNPQYLISPEFAGDSAMTVSFYYKGLFSYIQMGYSNTTDDVGDFIWGDTLIFYSSSWTRYVNSFPEGTKYVALKKLMGSNLSLDDFSFVNSESPEAPCSGVESLPHDQGFEDGMGCWSIVDGAVYQNLPTGIYYGQGIHEGEYSFLFVPDGSPQYLISPQFDGSSAMTVSFYYHGDDYSYIQVGHSTTTDDVGAFIWGDSLVGDEDQWLLYENSFPVGTKYVAVKETSDSSDLYYMFLDDFSFEAVPCSVAPSNLVVSMSDTYAVVSWYSYDEAWQLCLDNASNYIDVDEPTYTFTGLEPSSTHTVKVRSHCGSSYSEWTDPVSFTIPVPWLGDGTEENPYIITTIGQLEALAHSVNNGNSYEGEYFCLGADLTYDTCTPNNHTPIGNSVNHHFCGTFDGYYNGTYHTISGIRISNVSNYQGLFGTCYSSTVKNLTLTDAQITSSTKVAGIVSDNWDGTIENCHVTNTVVINGNKYVGGIAGWNDGGTVSGCSSMATVNGSGSCVGGLLGANKGGSLQNLILVGAQVTGNTKVGGIVGDNWNESTVEDCHVVDATISGNSLVGGIVGWKDGGMVKYCTVTDVTVSAGGGAIIGTNNNGPFQYNYYMGCTVGEATANIGTGNGDVTADDGAVRGYYLTLAEHVTSDALTFTIPAYGTTPETTYHVAGNGTTITLGYELPGRVVTYYVNGVAITGDTFTMPAEDVSVTITWTPDPAHFEQTDTDEYTIYTATGWDLFCDALQDNATYNRFIGKTVKLDADIIVVRMAGGSGHEFMGTFDGQGHTLTVDYTTTAQFTAPFSYINGATIMNLTIGGTINTSAKFAGGMVGATLGVGTIEITNCVSGVTINSSVNGDGTHGGFLAVASYGAVNFSGCMFSGEMLTESTTLWGGFVGWTESNHNATVTFTDCFFNPTNLATNSGRTFTRARNMSSVTITNSYYTVPLGTAQGYPAVSDPAITPVGEPTGTYNVSGLTAYVNGLMCGDTFYYNPDRNFQLTIDGYSTGSGGWNLLASPVVDTLSPTPANGFLTNAYDLYRFNPTHVDNEWENYKADSFTLENGRGYLYANSGDVTLNFGGVPVAGNTYEVALVYDSIDIQKCWNLVGNPFTCNATLDREYYVLRSDGLGINPVAIPATTPVPPFTAVFVKAVAEGDAAVFTKVTQ